MKVKYSFVCEAANIAQSGNLNVLGIFRNINGYQFPLQHPKLTYIANLEFHRSEEGTHKFKVTFIDDDGKFILQPLSGELEVNGSSLSANLMLDIANITFPKPGTYAIDLVVDNQLATTDLINVLDANNHS